MLRFWVFLVIVFISMDVWGNDGPLVAKLPPEVHGAVSRVIREIQLQKTMVPVAVEPQDLSIDHFSDSQNKKVHAIGLDKKNKGHEGSNVKATPGAIDIIIHQVDPEERDRDHMLREAFSALISGQAEVAIVLYRQVLKVDKGNTNALFGLATAYQRNGQVEQARSVYQDLLDVAPDHKDGINNFLALMAEESPEGALTELARLQAAAPEYSPIYAHMAVINVRLGRLESAIDNMKNAVRISPHNLSYRYNLAVFLDKVERWDLAANLYKQLIRASHEGAVIPGSVSQLEERLAYIRNNMQVGG